MWQELSRPESEDDLSQVIPSGDNHDVARAVFDTTIKRALDMTAELQAIADQHFDAAPTSSLHVLELNRAIARSVSDWIDQWSR